MPPQCPPVLLSQTLWNTNCTQSVDCVSACACSTYDSSVDSFVEVFGLGGVRVGVGRGDGLPERAFLGDPGHTPAAVVPAVVLDDLRDGLRARGYGLTKAARPVPGGRWFMCPVPFRSWP